jgi:thioredoxin reductase
MSLVQLKSKIADSGKIYQLLIIGGGPGGLTAGLYASRAGLDALLIEKGASGGQILVTDWIENYPGFPGLSGFGGKNGPACRKFRFADSVGRGHVNGFDRQGQTHHFG